jgi:hypothetical protein
MALTRTRPAKALLLAVVAFSAARFAAPARRAGSLRLGGVRVDARQ